MKTIQIIILITLSLKGFGQIDYAKNAKPLLQEMKEKSKTIGVTACVSVDGEVKWESSEGFSDYKQKAIFSSSTKTRIASIAKPMTAIAIMQLGEKNLLELDDLICKYLKDCPAHWKTITIRQLLSHTSGIKGYLNSEEAENQIEFKNLQEAISIFENRELSFSPGTDFLYTSYGYVVLGRIIEEISGLTYENYMKQHIWMAVGMENTGIEGFQNDATQSKLYFKKNKKKVKEAKKNNLSNRIPAGGFYSTSQDLLKFGNALLDNTLISPESFEAMIQNQFKQKEGNPYGLGWFLYAEKGNENSVIGHSGEQTGASTQIMLIPKSKTVVVVLSNTSGVWKDVVNLSVELMGLL